MQGNYFTCKNIAKMLEVNVRSVYRWCRTGHLKYTCPTGRDYLISKKDLDEFMNSEIGILYIMRAGGTEENGKEMQANV